MAIVRVKLIVVTVALMAFACSQKEQGSIINANDANDANVSAVPSTTANPNAVSTTPPLASSTTSSADSATTSSAGSTTPPYTGPSANETLITTAAVPSGGAITVDFSKAGAAPTHAGAGFLYGLNEDGTGPDDTFLQPLQVTLMRGGGHLNGSAYAGDGLTKGPQYTASITSSLKQAARLPNVTYHLLLSDLWGAYGSLSSNLPCDDACGSQNGTCTAWIRFLKQVVSDVQASGLRNIAYEPYNEPDGGFWPSSSNTCGNRGGLNSNQYQNMWNTAVKTIRSLDPNAGLVGPSTNHFDVGELTPFIANTVAAGTVPTVLNWHFSDDPVVDAAKANSILSKANLTGITLSINEYQWGDQQNASRTAWYLARLSKSGIAVAAHAIWSDCCAVGLLDNILMKNGSTLSPKGQWWVYQRYGAQSGVTVLTTGVGGVDGAATMDAHNARVNVLLGSNNGFKGTATVQFKGMDAATFLTTTNYVHIDIEQITDTAPLTAPTQIVTGRAAIVNNTITVSFPWANPSDAYAIQLGN